MSIQPLTWMFHKSENIRISQNIRHQQNNKYNKKGSDDNAEIAASCRKILKVMVKFLDLGIGETVDTRLCLYGIDAVGYKRRLNILANQDLTQIIAGLLSPDLAYHLLRLNYFCKNRLIWNGQHE